jgi:hypothetical protein
MTEVEQPTAKIHFHVDDKIAFGKEYAYSSVTYGLGITREVPDEGNAADLVPYVRELVEEVENFVAEERKVILDIIQGQASSVS